MTKLADSSQLPRNYNHQFYIDRYRSLSTIAQRINEEIEELKEHEKEINRKLAAIRKGLKSELMEKWSRAWEKSSENLMPIKPGQKRYQKRLKNNKGQMDMEYLQQFQEEVLLSPKNIHGGMTTTSCGTQDLNDLIKSMAQRIQHGSKNKKEETKIHDKLKELKITREKMYTAPEPTIQYSYGNGYYWHRYHWGEEKARARKQSLRRELKDYLFDVEILQGDQIKVMRLEAKLRLVKQDIISLQTCDLEEVNSERRITYNLIRMLHLLQETCYDEYQSLSLSKKYFAEDVPKVKQLCSIQVKGFMAKWNENEAFRDDVY